MSYYASSRPRSRFTMPTTSSFNDRRGSGSHLPKNYGSSYNYDWTNPKSSVSNSYMPSTNMNSVYNNSYSLPRNYKKLPSSNSKNYYTGISSATPSTGGYLLGHYTISPVVSPSTNSATMQKYQHLSSTYSNPSSFRPYVPPSRTSLSTTSKPHSLRAPSPEVIQKEQARQQMQIQLQFDRTPHSKCDANNVKGSKIHPDSVTSSSERKQRMSLKKRLSSSLSSLVTSLSGSLSNLAHSPISVSSKQSSIEYYEDSDDGSYDFNDYSDSVCSGRSSGASSDVEPSGTDSRSENGLVTRVNYKKLYEETIKENQLLKMRLTSLEEKMTDLKLKVDRNSSTPRISPDESNAREKRALEGKLSEMEEELKESRHLRSENQKLRDENGALIRVISKLSK